MTTSFLSAEEWEAGFARPILRVADAAPGKFLEILVERSKGEPAVLPIYAAAIGDFHRWLDQETARLAALRVLGAHNLPRPKGRAPR